LTGRADLAVATVVKVAAVTKTKLRTEAAPIAANRNHAHVTGWPLDKPTQKIIAQELAAAASFVPKPDDSQWDCLCKPSRIWIRIMRANPDSVAALPRCALCGKERVNKKYCQEKTAHAANITR
jgi:hypothetical protein